jgi:hypothetical protein
MRQVLGVYRGNLLWAFSKQKCEKSSAEQIMDLNGLLQALGYLRSEQHWVTLETADPRLAHHYRLAQRAGEEAGKEAKVIGSYMYQTSLNDKLMPPHPAIFVAYAQNEEQAREIHKRFWNLGNCPFILIVLPGIVRVYTGFNYDPNSPKQTIIAHTPDSFSNDLPDALLPFHADAIDSGYIWQHEAKYLGSETRVDHRLLANLKKLSIFLQDRYDLGREVAHALIGKYIYFRYLRDRNILDDIWLDKHGIRPENVFGREATAQGFEALAEALQKQFNGDIFPLPPNDGQWYANNAISFLASIFHGDTPEGQLALDFQIYDFSYIPVELLSSVYEQFLKDEGRGKTDGVVYTPEALADYILAELDALHPLQLNHKVLDPCCGSGVFLVLAYRRLIERLWHEQEERPTAEAMKHLLQGNIFGVEKDQEACNITAFSLILTLLSHLEPPELQANADFQFPTLVGSNIYQADFFDDNCPIFQKEMRFDWVMGNPPWERADEKNESHRHAINWMSKALKLGRKVGERRLDEAFTWRAGDVLKEGGHAGLLVMATSLINSSSSDYRKGFFNTFYVQRVTNLSNFMRILFMGPEGKRAEAPAACLIYKNDTSTTRKEAILHFGPFVANQIPLSAKGQRRRAWTLTIYENDIQEIDYKDATDDIPCLWKTALWGGYQDRRALRRLKKLLPNTLADVIAERGWLMCSGPHIKPLKQKSQGKFIPASELEGQRILETKFLKTKFAITDEALPLLEAERQFIEKRKGPKGLQLIPAPHVLVAAEAAVYSDRDFIIPAPKVGIVADRKDADYLKATAFYLNSSVARYAHFFHSPLWGISIGTISPETVGAIPFTRLSAEQVKTLAKAYDELVSKEQNHMAEYAFLQSEPLNLQNEVDKIVNAALRIPESLSTLAREFMQIRYQLSKGKLGDTAIEPPTADQLKEYGEQLRSQIDDFTRRHHRITIQAGQEAIIATIEVTSEPHILQIIVSQNQNSAAKKILHSVKEQHSQWAYVQRSVQIFDGPYVHIIKAARLLDWTRTQAIQDAANLISEVLSQTEPYYESAPS